MIQATSDLAWLLSRGYAIHSASELVGNRYSLAARQRLAVTRSACSQDSACERALREVRPDQLRGEELWIDGLNVLTGLEVALSGGVILIGHDGCCRDVAGVHRHYRRVQETLQALDLVAETTRHWGVSKCCWWLDKPVSNTGRLKGIILEAATRWGCNWEAELVYSPDAVLSKATQVVATSDSVILDRCERWVNLARALITARIPGAHCIFLGDSTAA
ncbi:MAG: DUF434 domain-containing protein [Verrucomicrobiia bacterium]